MKANGAPEKIWIDNLDEGFWFDSPSGNKSIEYVRKDAFIEKAENYFKDQFIKDVSILAGSVVSINFSIAIKNFINYMKGE